MKQYGLIACVMLAVAACSGQPKGGYSLSVALEQEYEGKTAYLYDMYRGANIDSTVVINGVADFFAYYDSSAKVVVMIDEKGVTSGFYLTPDSISVSIDGDVDGGVLNKKNSDYWDARLAAVREYNNLPDSLKNVRYESFAGRIDSLELALMNDNIDNALGINYFLLRHRDLTIQQIDSVQTLYPSLVGNAELEKSRRAQQFEKETTVGQKFKDFTVEYNDTVFRLSDVVGNGKYVLVDFWASWCGPCIKQAEVIKDIYKEYHPKGLEVIGVMVWDEPENSLKAIKDHDVPWRNVVNAQSIPTDIYGIQGIPCIMLFGPDGTILSRDKQNGELEADVAAAMDGK